MADTETKTWPRAWQVQLTSSLWVSLPLVRANEEGFSFYSFNMIGKANWNRIAAQELLNRLISENLVPQLFITAEAKAIALTQELAGRAGHDRYVVLRKSRKSYMNNPTVFHGESITSGRQEYWIEQEDIDFMRNKVVIVVDDVISTGKTAKTFLDVINRTECRVNCFCCAITEGTEWKKYNDVPVVSLGHIPLPGVIK